MSGSTMCHLVQCFKTNGYILFIVPMICSDMSFRVGNLIYNERGQNAFSFMLFS